MRRLRKTAAALRGPRTYTARARNSISAAARFQAWLAERGTSPADCRQADIDDWVTTTGPRAADAADFLAWAARHGHCSRLELSRPAHNAGTTIADNDRRDLAERLLHNDTITPADRVASCLVLLFGQHATRHVINGDDEICIQLGKHAIPVPATLGTLLLDLIADGRPYTGTGSPATSKWLFPGLLPGRPISPARLADRLRALGIPVQANRRGALTGLAAQLPAAVLADALGISPGTAVPWANDAGTDWTRYAAELARTGDHEPGQ